jgi:glucosylceramidase
VATVDPQTHTFTLSQDYYELAQLSHFVAPGATRIGSNTFVSYGLTPSYQPSVSVGLDDVAFQNLNGSEVLFAYNNSAAPITFAVRWRGGYVIDTVAPGATTTFTWGCTTLTFSLEAGQSLTGQWRRAR